ncbi:putative quinol monooxygenase [Sphingomonas canadensis]|uniref:Quinol monooxygenase n=1 Tax=Sphingomonas canadensis TaxID=1219257 RepID=A0ABW3H7D1_9SPHN|nr:antibiotic biosynthesis monooxygenase family protein [Sphingomonas canadensis]MCW3836799.1 antibiotic biosynthesis monooxygenase [Sphingomonas canadensis]
MIGRRPLLAGLALAVAGAPALARAEAGMEEEDVLFGLIGKIRAHPGQRDALLTVLGGSSQDIPGCLAYILGEDAADPDIIWVTEVWASREAHHASLSLPAVQAAISVGRRLIASFDLNAEMRPVAGIPGR